MNYKLFKNINYWSINEQLTFVWIGVIAWQIATEKERLEYETELIRHLNDRTKKIWYKAIEVDGLLLFQRMYDSEFYLLSI